MLAATCFVGPLWASEPGPSFSLEFAVPSGCPERQAFVAAVISRTRASEVPVGAAGFALHVEVEGDGERASGRLSIRLADGQQSSREIPAGSCREVLASMAVISALVLDGHGLDAPLPGPVATEAAQAPDANAPSSAPEKPASRAAPAPTESTPNSAKRDPEVRLRVRAVLQGSLETAVAPGVSPGIAAGGELALERSSWFSPSAELLGRFVAGGRETTRFGDARFQLLALSLATCPARFQPVRSLSLRPCLHFDAGQLRGDGRRTLERATERMPWVGLGAMLRTEAELASFLALQIEVRADALLQHDRFIFQPGVVAHDVPPWALGVGMGLIFGPQ